MFLGQKLNTHNLCFFGTKKRKNKQEILNLIKSDQIWSNLISNLIKFDQNSDLIRFDQIWSDLIRFGQTCFFQKNKTHKNNLFVLFHVFFGNWTWLWLQLLSFKHSLAVKGWLLQKNYVLFQAPVFVLRSTDCKAFGHSFWLESNAVLKTINTKWNTEGTNPPG